MLRTPRSLRRLAAVATAAASVMALSGCTLVTTLQEAARRDEAAANFSATEGVPEQLHRYYEQQLEWSSCEGGLECATAIAPMNWDDPSAGEDVELALVRRPATGRRIGSLFTNPGGPGASGYDMVVGEAALFGSEVMRSYDVVGWDPRGVGRSSAVDCLDDAGMDQWNYTTDPTPAPQNESDEEIIASAREAAAWFGEQCLQHTGPLLEFVDTMSTVRDLDLLRALVGDPKLNYFGFSYGTDIGARYVDTFPRNVGRVVLDGATDPSLSQLDVLLAQRTAFGEATRAYLEDCLARGSACPFSGDVDGAIAEINRLMQDVDRNPVVHSDGRVLTSSVIDTAISAALYSEESWPYLSDAFSQYLRAGDPAGFFLLADFYNGREADGSYPDNMMEAFVAINCLDAPVVTDQQQIVEFNRRLAEADPLGDPGPETMGDVLCENWPFQSRVTPGPVSGAGAAPVVVVGTTGDPATPMAWSEAVADQLESGVLLRFEGEGHLAYPQGDRCVTEAVDAYLVDGTVPQDGMSC
ncbi:MAG: alpha/beta hydrolase [Pseudoclavibacter sp.]|nr:alpha/beta hydrolase [Pseudoclavibacter sp.]